ncbi:lytic murein transglycosylase, partial [Escherichia coli]|nr:lytic murein transglycosylase [Escherichia coli]
ENFKGSWAGAMGQCQFMPSSFLRFAADGNGDGKKDIWQSEADVFASTANYLSKSGWDDNILGVAKLRFLKILIAV